MKSSTRLGHHGISRPQFFAVLIALLCSASFLFDAGGSPIQPVSVPGLPVVSGGGNSFTPSFSSDGHVLVFVSQANNLVTNDNLAPYIDVFVRDFVNRRTSLVSVNSSGVGGGDGNSNFPTISSNGQLVAFESVAGNLAGVDTNGVMDVFVRDLGAGTTSLASVSTDGIRSGNGPSSSPSITPDGRWLVFESAASDLVANDTNGVADVFVRDLQAGVTWLVSAGETNRSGTPSITPDGRFVAFVNTISNAVPTPLAWANVYLRDLLSNTTISASAQATNFFPAGQLPIRCLAPVMSSDGHYVAYKATPRDDSGAPARLLRTDLQSGATVLVSVNTTAANPPEISADGRFIAYEGETNVFVWDGQGGSNFLVSVRSGGTSGANRPSHTPVMTPDGTKVVFLSAATDLVTNAANGISQVFIRDLAAGTTRLVSANLSGDSNSGDIDVTLPAISTDGRLVAFESSADDLVSGDFNQASDIFVRDLEASTTQLVSERDPALSPLTGVALCSVLPHAVSDNGQVIAFLSRDSNLVAGDTNAFPDFFVRDLVSKTNCPLRVPNLPFSYYDPTDRAPWPVVSADGRYAAFIQPEQNKHFIWRRDLQTGTNERASVSLSATGMPGRSPAISGDGELVGFESSASVTAFVPGISDAGVPNVLVHDFGTGSNQLISVNASGNLAGNNSSTEPLFSPDGHWVLFASLATDLRTKGDPAGIRRLFARDLLNSVTVLVSIGPDGSFDWGYATGAVFSADSRFVAWVAAVPRVLVTGLFDQSHVLVCDGCENSSLSGDGRLIAYQTLPNASSPFRQVAVKDLQTGASNLVSISRTGTAGDGHSTTPQISADGRFVVFGSKAGNLVENDTNGMSDIFVRDRLLGTTLLVSVNTQGTASGNSASSQPILAADGRTVVFQSFANDLITGDYNDRRDIFVLRLGGVDSDGDGLDDDWEMTYFGNLSRDGTGDFDHDGQTDREEFLAGTNPTSDASLLRVLTLASLNGGSTTLLWSAVPGRSYRVQFKNSVDDPQWSELPGDVTATTSTGSAVDSMAGAQAHRFYRVVRLP